MEQPKISIIIPSFNQGQFITETLESVLNQSYQNIEILVIDGGSTDNTIPTLEKYDSRIAYWVSENDKGTYDANNKGLSKITGDYWCILNSDDILLPNALDKVVESVEETNASWIAGGVSLIDEKSCSKAEVLLIEPSIKTAGLSFITKNWIYHPATFLHRSILEEVGYFIDSDIMDYEYWLRLESAGYFPVIIDSLLAGLRFHSDCKSMDYLKMYKLNVSLLRDYASKIDNKMFKSEVEERIHEWDREYLMAQLRLSVVNKSVIGILNDSLSLLVKFPGELCRRMYWGTVMRYKTGLSLEEYHPYHFMFDEG